MWERHVKDTELKVTEEKDRTERLTLKLSLEPDCGGGPDTWG